MTTTSAAQAASSSPADLETLCAPIHAFPADSAGGCRLKAEMLALASQLEGLYQEGEGDTLEADIVWTALFSFPALVNPGPPPRQLVSLLLEGRLADEEAATLLQTLSRIRSMLVAFDPPGFTAALWQTTLLSIYSMIEVFVLLDDERGINHCFELLDIAEEIAGKLDPSSMKAA